MNLSRRVLIRNITIGLAGYTLLPSCTGINNQPLSLSAGKLGLKADDEATVAALCRMILPLKGVGGEIENTGLHPFVLKMVADCEAPENRERFKSGLAAFKEKVKGETGHSVEKANSSKLIAVLYELEGIKESGNDDLAFFYRLTKSLAIRGYKGSRFFLTQVQPYVLVPGKYQGCI